jgi:alpha-D-xyloside xylohydrolase
MGKIMQYTSEKLNDTLEIRIYKGADASFELYEDEGDNYNYEKGSYTIIPFKWNDEKQSLSIGSLQGSYPNALKSRVFNVVFVGDGKGAGIDEGVVKKSITYKGKSMLINGNYFNSIKTR